MVRIRDVHCWWSLSVKVGDLLYSLHTDKTFYSSMTIDNGHHPFLRWMRTRKIALCWNWLTQKLTKSLTLNFWRVWCKTSNSQVMHSVSFGDQTSQDNGSASPTTDGNFHSECVSRFSRVWSGFRYGAGKWGSILEIMTRKARKMPGRNDISQF